MESEKNEVKLPLTETDWQGELNFLFISNSGFVEEIEISTYRSCCPSLIVRIKLKYKGSVRIIIMTEPKNCGDAVNF